MVINWNSNVNILIFWDTDFWLSWAVSSNHQNSNKKTVFYFTCNESKIYESLTFEISYKKKITFSPYLNFLRCTCTCQKLMKGTDGGHFIMIIWMVHPYCQVVVAMVFLCFLVHFFPKGGDLFQRKNLLKSMTSHFYPQQGVKLIIVSLWETGVKNLGFDFYLLPVYIEVLINTEILLVYKQLAWTRAAWLIACNCHYCRLWTRYCVTCQWTTALCSKCCSICKQVMDIYYQSQNQLYWRDTHVNCMRLILQP